MKPYRWDAIPQQSMPASAGEVMRRFMNGEQMTVAQVTFTAGAVTDPHRHVNEQFSLVLAGEMEFTVEGETVRVREGEVLHLPSNCFHGAKAITASTILDVFSPPRADWGNPPAQS